MIKKGFPYISVLLLFLLPPTNTAHSQSLNNDNAIFIGVNGGLSPIENSFTKEFTPSPAVSFNISFPYLAGRLEGGIRYIHFDGHANTNVNSDFKSFYIYAGYYYPFKITDWYSLGPVLRIGYILIYYQDRRIYTDGPFQYKTERVEGEFAYEFALRNQFQISNHLLLQASIFYNHTYTNIPLPLTMVSVGISYAFSEPEWFKTIIK